MMSKPRRQMLPSPPLNCAHSTLQESRVGFGFTVMSPMPPARKRAAKTAPNKPVTDYPLHAAAHAFPEMASQEFAAFKEDIRQHGQKDPIWIHQGSVIDGRHRLRACRELGIEAAVREWDGKGSLADFVVSRNLHRRHLSAGQKAMVAAELLPAYQAEARARQGARTDLRPFVDTGGRAAERAGASLGVGRQYVHTARKLLQESPTLALSVRAGELTLPQAVQAARRARTTSEPHVVATHGRASKVSSLYGLAATGAKFGCIYADPPWQYTNSAGRSASAKHYEGLSIKQLCALPVHELAADRAHCHLWTTNAFLLGAMEILDAWGFEYRSAFIWVKPQMGTGNYWRVSHEFMLLGVRGDMTFRDRSMKSWLEVPRTSHSAKPDAVRKLVERASPGPYLELFARSPVKGWTVFGNQIARAAK
ncbi:MT-A70 family methyltransferase [soil metagenome]